MKRALRRARDRVILGLRGAPPSVIVAYRTALAEAGVDARVVDAYTARDLATFAPSEHRRLLAVAATRQFAPTARPAVARKRGTRPRMLLHVGAHKTGTTSTQLVMHADRDRLWDHGVLYPSAVGFLGTRQYFNHNRLQGPLMGPNPSSDRDLSAFRRYITELSQGAELTVLSAERLYGALDGEQGLIRIQEWDESYWPKRRRFAAKLAAFLSDFDVTPVVWLRSPDAFADSLYREVIKANIASANPAHRRYSGSFSQFRTDAAPLWDYDQEVRVLEEAFGDAVVHRFEDGDVIDTMYSHLGVAPPTDAKRRRANSSADGRIALWLSGTNLGTSRQRQAFGHSAEAAAALREGSAGSIWESEAARTAFLAGVTNTRFGPDFFPAPTPLKDLARLTDGDEARLSAAFEAWSAQHPDESFPDLPDSELVSPRQS